MDTRNILTNNITFHLLYVYIYIRKIITSQCNIIIWMFFISITKWTHWLHDFTLLSSPTCLIWKCQPETPKIIKTSQIFRSFKGPPVSLPTHCGWRGVVAPCQTRCAWQLQRGFETGHSTIVQSSHPPRSTILSMMWATASKEVSACESQTKGRSPKMVIPNYLKQGRWFKLIICL